jgi:hypothetical protein
MQRRYRSCRSYSSLCCLRLILIGSPVLNFVQVLFCNSFHAVAVAASSILNGDESAPYTRPGVVLLTTYNESWPQNASLLFSGWRGWTGGNSSSSSQSERKCLAGISFRILCSVEMVGQRRWTWVTRISSIQPEEMDSGLTRTGTLHGWQQSWLQGILSLGMLWYLDMWNVDKGMRHWNYFEKCGRKVCSQVLWLSLGNECLCQCRCSWSG